MKNYVIKILTLIIVSILLIGTPYSSFAAKKNTKKTKKTDATQTTSTTAESLDTDITGEGFYEDFNPTTQADSSAQAIANPIIKFIQTIVNPILGIIQIIGGIVMVLSIAFYGFQNILSADSGLTGDLGIGVAPRNKRKYLAAGRSLIIGSVILFMSTTIVKMVFNFFL